MASFRPLEDPDEAIRGSRVLNALLSSSPGEGFPLVNQIWVESGHCAVAYGDHQRLCVFDSVPKAFRLADHEQQLLLQSVRSEEFLRTVGVNMLHEEYSSHITCVLFSSFPNGVVRLLVILENGELHSWRWNSFDYTWIFEQKLVFTSLDEHWKVVNAQYSMSESKLFWRQDKDLKGSPLFVEVYERPITFSTNPIESMGIPKVIVSSLAHVTNANLFMIGHHGLWFRLADSILLWDLRENLYNISDRRILDSSNLPGEVSITYACLHTTGSEVVILDSLGQVYAGYLSKGKIRVKNLCKVALQSGHVNTNDHKPGAFFAFAHRHWIGLIAGRSCALHHILTGVLLHKLPWPAAAFSDIDSLALWTHKGGGGSVGVWGRSGVWKLVTQRIQDEISTIAHSDGCGPLFAASLANQWGLIRVRTKQLVDYTVAVKHMMNRRSVVPVLSRLLSNPALLLAILPSPMFNSEVVEELKQYLQRINADCSTKSKEDKNLRVEVALTEAARGALRYFTVLNQTCTSFLSECVKLSSPDLTSFELNKRELDSSELLNLPRGSLEAWCRRCPAFATPMLESLISQRPVTSHDAVHPDGHSLFELTCRAYYFTAPKRLIPFIRAVDSSAPPPYPSYWMIRARDCIPPPTNSSTLQQVDTHVHLLGSCGLPSVALELCLSFDMWERACQLVRAARDHSDGEYSELLGKLFVYAADHSPSHWRDAVGLTRTGLLGPHSAIAILDKAKGGIVEGEYDGDILLVEEGQGLSVASLFESISWEETS